jgi:hypothetical protein
VILPVFNEIWCGDFEFATREDGTPDVKCAVFTEFFSNRTLRYGAHALQQMDEAPMLVGKEDVCFVSYYSLAELSCFSALGWAYPCHNLDLFTEFRALTNGGIGNGNSLLNCQAYFGIKGGDAVHKENMRALAMRQGVEYTPAEWQDLLDYWETDVVALLKLLPVMLPKIQLEQALWRGEYMKAAATIERNGIPIDYGLYRAFLDHRETILTALTEHVDKEYGVYEGATFKTDKFQHYLAQNGIPWPRSEKTGRLELKDEVFKDQAARYPILEPLRQLRKTRAQMSKIKLHINQNDHRARCGLSPFRSVTGRNQPSTNEFVFGLPAWLRSLIKPREGYGVAYIDWAQQEIGIAAALANDENLKQAYDSGDPYLEFAKQSGLAPAGATKATHKKERDCAKLCVLAVQYGMGAESLAERLNEPVPVGKDLLDKHLRTYRVYYKWQEELGNRAQLTGTISTVYGWTMHVTGATKSRTILNFPMQANGAEMMRLACLYGLERGIKICATVHDALLIEAPLDVFDDHVERMREAMSDASATLLDGFRLRTSVDAFRYPERFMDERGEQMFGKVMELLNALLPKPVHG